MGSGAGWLGSAPVPPEGITVVPEPVPLGPSHPELSSKKIHLQCRRIGLHPWVGKIPWRRKWQPTPVFVPGKAHG